MGFMICFSIPGFFSVSLQSTTTSRSSMEMCPPGCSFLTLRLPKPNNIQMLWKLLASSTSPAAFTHLRAVGAEAESPPAVLHVSHQLFAYYDK